MDRFVNPYTFAPLGDPVRGTPEGHLGEGSGDRLSGTIEVAVTLETPMLVTDYVRGAWLDADKHLTIPGSSVKGATRSVHEAAFNGCLRVVDGDFVPGYRAPASTEDGWTLAVVLSQRGGMPTAFQPCDPKETVWVDAVSLAQRWPHGDPPTSGDRVFIDGEVVDTSLERYELTSVAGVDLDARVKQAKDTATSIVDGDESELFGPEGVQVFLVTDTGVRKTTKRNGSPGRCLWASSVLLAEALPFKPDKEDKDVYDAFRHAASGTNDRRTLEQDAKESAWRSSTAYVDVMWHGRKVGRRARQTGFLFPGDVVWIRRDGKRIRGIKLAAIWREAGNGAVRTRIGQAHPCLTESTGGDEICLSCETFGAADASEGKRERDRREQATQRSYAGHVRFGALRSAKPVDLSKEFQLAPLSTPNPGSGGFYLQMDRRVARDARQNEIAAHWGSRTDRAGASPIKGRKFYWHADPTEQRNYWAERNGRQGTLPRYEATPEQVKDKQGRERKTSQKARLVSAGTRLTGKVTVDALPAEHVAALLASLDPRRLLMAGKSDRRLVMHLGGGKPYGLGSVTIDVVPHLHRVRQRYTDSEPAEQECGDRIDDATWKVLAARSGATRDGLEPLLRILDLEGLGADTNLVSYPPGADWARFGTQPFRESYQFFQRANGQQLKRGPRPWHVLPDATADDVTLPIIDRNQR